MPTKTQTKTRVKSTQSDSDGPVLTASDIIRGGDRPALNKAVVEGVIKGGKPGVIYFRNVSAGRMVGLMEMDESDEKGQVSQMIDLICEVVTNEDGSPMFSRDALLAAPVDAVVAVMNAISGINAGKKKGKA